MSGKRIWKNVGRYALRFVTLLIAISIVSFVLVSLSPVDRCSSMWAPCPT